MTDSYSCNDAAFLSGVGGYQALPDLLRLLARGQPVDLGELTEVSGPAGGDLARAIRAEPGSDWDASGRLVGFGLTLRPTGHRLEIDGRSLYTWCASDTLFFTVILGKETVAESTCPTTAKRVRLEISPDGVTSATPPETVVSQRQRSELLGNLRSDVCDHGHFFASPSAAAGWAAEHPDGQVLAVAEAFAACRGACETLGWLPPGVPGP